jgi:RNA polymerase sigma-70 factor (ECF subfamily)
MSDDLPTTRPSLLVRVRDATDQAAWQEFVAIYAPIVYGFARKRGLQDSDAGDLTQEVLLSVSAAVGQLDYDPRRGMFRSWLFTVARNKLHDFARARQRRVQGSGRSDFQAMLEELPAREENLWDEEYRLRLFQWAAERVQGHFTASTWQAFWLVAVENKPPRQVAQQLALSLAAVYMAKSRVQAALKAEIQEVLGESV